MTFAALTLSILALLVACYAAAGYLYHINVTHDRRRGERAPDDDRGSE